MCAMTSALLRYNFYTSNAEIKTLCDLLFLLLIRLLLLLLLFFVDSFQLLAFRRKNVFFLHRHLLCFNLCFQDDTLMFSQSLSLFLSWWDIFWLWLVCFFPPAALAIFLCRLFESKCKNDTEDYGAYLLLSLIMLFMT